MYGTPTENDWSGITRLPNFKNKFPQFKGKGLSTYCTNMDERAVDLF